MTVVERAKPREHSLSTDKDVSGHRYSFGTKEIYSCELTTCGGSPGGLQTARSILS